MQILHASVPSPSENPEREAQVSFLVGHISCVLSHMLLEKVSAIHTNPREEDNWSLCFFSPRPCPMCHLPFLILILILSPKYT